MKTIAIIGDCNTKCREIAYIREQVKNQGVKAMVINVATGLNPSYGHDVSREDVTKAAEKKWTELEPETKGEKVAFMMEAVASYAEKSYKEGKIDGTLSAGGLQNTIMATNAMKWLPIGFPKVMTTTVASGRRTFESVIGTKDIITVPPICGFTRLNIVTRQIMKSVYVCCIGTVKYAGQILKESDRPVMGVTLMEITNTGTYAVTDELEGLGMEIIGFHSADAGGTIMERMTADGLIDGILDLMIHETTQEYFKGGFSYGEDAKYRLIWGVKKRVPLAVSVGGLDFIDFQAGEFPPYMDEKVHMMHNVNTAHIKLLPDEVEIITARFAARIERIDYPVKFLIPTDGMRHNIRKDEILYYKEVDDVIVCQLKETRSPDAEVIAIPGNLDTKDWGIKTVHCMIDELKEHGVIGDEIQY